MKKHFTAILILTAALGTLVGCGSSVDIGKEEAARIALEDAGFSESDVSRLYVSKDGDDGRVLYEIEFTNDNTEYDYEILASNGEILKSGSEEKNNTDTLGQQNETKKTQTEQQGNVDAQGQESNSDNGNNQVQTGQQSNGGKSKSSGQNNVKLTQEEAAKLALDRVPGATEKDLKIELDYDDGYYVYEGDIIYNQKEYEFEIDANTGTFLEWSEERR